MSTATLTSLQLSKSAILHTVSPSLFAPISCHPHQSCHKKPPPLSPPPIAPSNHASLPTHHKPPPSASPPPQLLLIRPSSPHHDPRLPHSHLLPHLHPYIIPLYHTLCSHQLSSTPFSVESQRANSSTSSSLFAFTQKLTPDPLKGR